MNAIRNELIRKIIARVMNVSNPEEFGLLSIETLDSWDSISHLSLMLELEKEFDIKIPIETSVTLTDEQKINEEINGLKSNQ